MNCLNHPEAPAVAYCRECGKALCETCRRQADGTVYCEEHAAGQRLVCATAAARASTSAIALHGARASPYTTPDTVTAASMNRRRSIAGLAFLLGFIPGVGAIYNGQYVKGLIHVVIFGVLIAS